MNMLTKDDLQAIGQLIEEKAVKPLSGRVDSLGAKIDVLKLEMDTKFDAVQERFDEIENKMLTKPDLERWETGLTERYDKRYVRQTI